jgi:sugar phosphate isomerase/epimerase
LAFEGLLCTLFNGLNAATGAVVNVNKEHSLMSLSRRQFLSASSVAFLSAVALGGPRALAAIKPRLGVCDWSIGYQAKPGALDFAKKVGLGGVQVSSGSGKDDCELTDAAIRQQFKDTIAKTGVVACSTAMGFLNTYPFATDPRGPKWLEQTIDITKDLDAKCILLAFFGDGDLRKGDVLKEKDIDAVVQRLKDAAPRAEKAGVILGLENMLSAKDNLAILDRVKSDAVRIYYDIYNSGISADYDAPAEIRMMKDRMCQVHFKNGKEFLGKGSLDMLQIRDALNDISYNGWIVLETSTPTNNREADFKTNADFVNKLFGVA